MANPTVAEINASHGSVTGAFSGAQLGTALPTDATTALAGAFKGYGYVGSDGIVPQRDVGTDDVKDMNGDTVYTLQTDFTRTYQVEFLQTTNVDVKKAIFGSSNVVVTAADGTHGGRIAVQDKGQQALHQVICIDVFDGLKKHREVASDAQITSVDIGPLVGTAVRSYTATFTVFKDSAGVFVYEYDDDGVPTA